MAVSARRTLIACYLGFEGLAIVSFWAAYFGSSVVRQWICPAGMEKVLGAFAFPDMVLLLPLTIGGVVTLLKQSRWAWTWLLLHCGASAYATLWTLAAAWMDAGWTISALLMLPMMLASIGAVFLLRDEVSP